MVPRAPDGQPLANFGHRFLAYLLDTVIIVVVSMVVIVPLYVAFLFAVFSWTEAATGPANGPPDAPVGQAVGQIFLLMIGMLAVVLAVMALLTYVYYVEMMFRSGQTIGKRVVKLRVVTLDGKQLTRGDATRRWLVQWGGGSLIPFFSYLDGLWQLWDKPFQQCLHDKFANTVVVKLPG
jgi:uncharacterized RDD family membrane protein YckC